MDRMNNLMWGLRGVQRESRTRRKKIADFGRFWVKEPRHSDTILDEKSATSIVARVLFLLHLR